MLPVVLRSHVGTELLQRSGHREKKMKRKEEQKRMKKNSAV